MIILMRELPDFEIYSPSSLRDLLEYLHGEGRDATIIANGTDLLPRIRRGELRPRRLVDISGVRELRYIREEDGVIKIGALTTISDLAESPLLSHPRYEAFHVLSRMFGTWEIRNRATVGGNLGAAASSEDLIPIFLALDARVRLLSLGGERVLRVDELVVAKRRTSRRGDEVIAEVSFKSLGEGEWSYFQKIGRRRTHIIALVSLASYLRLSPDGVIEDIRLAFNRVRGKIPERAWRTEEFLRDRRIDEEVISGAERVLESELRLTSDYRASYLYRTEVAKVFLRRALRHSKDMVLGGVKSVAEA